MAEVALVNFKPFKKGLLNPHPQGWGYTDKARLRGLLYKNDFLQPDLV
jgi:hypothetical protein